MTGVAILPASTPRFRTPAGFAHAASGGRWVSAPHLDLLNQKLMDVVAGKCKRLAVYLPPRHGKSFFISQYFPAYYLGIFPERRVILASYEADFAATWGRKAYSVVDQSGRQMFGMGASKNVTAASHWNLENEVGGMDTAGVGGPITGKGTHILLVDDPIKNAEEAASKTRRDTIWDWFTSTAYTRLEPGGAVILVNTRWHEDDVAGRLERLEHEGGEAWDVLNLPAIAEENDVLGRKPGEALWPERYDVAALEAIRKQIGGYFFDALYQGRPRPKEGGMFKRDWFERNVVSGVPDGLELCRYWDRAASQGKGDYTAGVLLGRSTAGVYYVVHRERGQWSSGERDKVIRHTAEADRDRFGDVMQRGEQEPGSAGVDAAKAFVALLEGFDVGCARSTGDKETRARPFASQCEFDNVKLVRGDWNEQFIDEHCSFPRGKNDDVVDAAAGAFSFLANREARPFEAAFAGERRGYSSGF